MIRIANENDIPGVAEIYDHILTEEEAGRAHIGWVRGIYPTEDTARAALKQNELYVEEEDGRIVAAAKINREQVPEYANADWEFDAPDDEIMVLHTLVVDPLASGRGYGKRFVNFYEEFARQKGCRFLRMDTNQINNLPDRRGAVFCAWTQTRSILWQENFTTNWDTKKWGSFPVSLTE